MLGKYYLTIVVMVTAIMMRTIEEVVIMSAIKILNFRDKRIKRNLAGA